MQVVTTSTTAWLALALTALTSVMSAQITLPTLYSCEPADIRVLAQGNFTIEGRDMDTHKLVFRAHAPQSVTSVTWSAVDLPPNATAVITVFDEADSFDTQDTFANASALVQPNPSGNTTCLHLFDKNNDPGHGGSKAKQKNMVPTIVGVVLGAFFLLVLLLVGGMMYKRKKEKVQSLDYDGVDITQNLPIGNAPAGGNYMSRLVPGLKLQEAKPLPRDPVLESEQANYTSTRRGTYYNKKGTDPEVAANSAEVFELPSYGNGSQQQRRSKMGVVQHGFHRKEEHIPTQGVYQTYSQRQQQLQRQQQPGSNEQYGAGTLVDPFASQSELDRPLNQHLQQQQHVYASNDWDHHSQTSFLTKKSSR